MTETSKPAPPAAPPEPRIVRKRQGISWIWIVPIVAALAGMSMVVRTWMMTGPEIVITFVSGEGIEVGKTQVRYKDVAVGTVSGVNLSDDRSLVEVKAQLSRDVADFAREGTRFWVVKPRLGLSGVSGLGTIMSGSYIAVDIPAEVSQAAVRHEFVGLESPPEVASGQPGTRYTMRANTLGSLDIGSPVYFRHMKAGQVISYQMAKDGRHVDVQVFVDKPFDGFVSADTRFWNASGVDVSVGASGVSVSMQSLATVLSGGVAFEDVLQAGGRPVAQDHVFELFGSEKEARAQVDGVRMRLLFRVDSSVRGLTPGADVDFRGLSLGSVTGLSLGFDKETKRFYTMVDAEIFPERLGDAYENVKRDTISEDAFMATMIENGFRAQLRTGNLLTGQLYIALDFFPQTAKAEFDPVRQPRLIPVVPGTLDQMQQQISSIVTKLERMPLDKIGRNLEATLGNAAALLGRLEKDLSPEMSGVLREARKALSQADQLISPDGSMALGLDRTLQELQRTARSLRDLADALQASPDSLLRGRAPDPQLFQGGR